MIINNQNLIWIDLEMTGLNPQIHRIIEISILITDAALNIISKNLTIAIRQTKENISLMNAWSRDTHKNTGLIEKVKNSEYNEKYAESEIISFLKGLVPIQSSPMCGNSIYHDRIFLKKYMPTLENYFHYRCIDVSTIKELISRWHPNIKYKKKNYHTAEQDIYESIMELHFYKRKFFDLKK